MPRFDVALHVEVDAETSDAAFAKVRTHYGIQDHSNKPYVPEDVQFAVEDEPIELGDDESVCD